MNIPIYRAKKIDSDEYVDGFLWLQDLIPCITEVRCFIFYQHGLNYKIDPSTLSIHFPDMLDSDGNKIFASLSEDGKGGDCLTDGDIASCLFYKQGKFILFGCYSVQDSDFNYLKVVGIQQ